MVSIPVRNIWWLMLYASDLGKDAQPSNLASEDLPEEIPDLVAEILVKAVEQRQRPTQHWLSEKEAVVSRVRGRIDHLKTSRRQLLARGQVACRFEELSIDTPRNRYVRAALDKVSRLVRRSELANRCSVLPMVCVSKELWESLPLASRSAMNVLAGMIIRPSDACRGSLGDGSCTAH